MRDVVLVTGREMPHGPETESPLLLAALRDRGLDAGIEPWGSPGSADARLVVIRTPWDYPGQVADFLDWVRSTGADTAVLNPPAVIEWNSHKSYLLDLAYAAVPVIDTAIAEQGTDAAGLQALLDEHTTEVVIKPAVSVGAIGVLRAAPESPAALAHLRELTAVGEALVQPFEPAILDGEVSLTYLGGEFSHAVRKTPADGDFRVQAFLGGTVSPHTATDAELAVGAAALSAVEADLAYARVDLVTEARGPVLMELELIEPQLFLESNGAAERYADVLVDLLTAT